jgi:hypothetical protein
VGRTSIGNGGSTGEAVVLITDFQVRITAPFFFIPATRFANLK